MTKKFNYTGTCIPGKHYMVDTTSKIEQIVRLIEDEQYFTINRPRQYGKTTTLLLLEEKLITKGYLPVSISLEGIGDDVFKTEEVFGKPLYEKCQKHFSLLIKNYQLIFQM